MADADPTCSPHSAPRMDVFGNVEPVLASKPQLVVHTREHQKVDDSPPSTPYTPIRPSSSRAGSRRTQSVDVASKHLNAPSPLAPARRKRGEREREKIRAELDAAPALTLDPRIAHDVLDLERRFAAASKGKSPVSSRPPHRSHRHRHSLGSSTLRPNVPAHPGSTEPPALSALPESAMPESDTSNFSGGDNKPPELVGPALPSSGVPTSPVVPSTPLQPLATAQADSPPKALKVDKPAYAALLPTSDPEAASGSGAEVKRTSKAAKRSSFTAMLGLGTRKKPKEASHQKDSAQEDDKHFSLPSLRPSPKRGETHNTTRTINTILTTHTGATAGSAENGDKASLSGLGSGHGQGLSPVSGARSASATSSNLRLVEEPSGVIEPSAKTLARAAATRDQLQKRYDMLYRSLGDASSAMGSEELSTRSVSGSGSILKRESPGPASGSIDSHPRPASKEHPPLKARGINPLEVVRWRSGILQRARRSAEAGRAEIEGRHGEEWERETERRIRDAPPGDHLAGMGPYAGSGVPAYQNVFPASLGDSLPEANSLSWLPYLEPVFAEERARAERSGEFAMGVGRGGSEVPKGMSAWYILASFVEGLVAAKEQEERAALAMEAEMGVVRGPAGSFVSDGLKSFVSADGPKSMTSEMQGRGTFSDIPLKDPHTRSITSDVRAKAIVNAAYAHARGTGTGTISDDAASGTGSRFAILDRALRTKSRRSSIIAESIGGRSRQGSLGLGTTSEPPSPSHFTAFSPPILSSASPATSQTSHPGAKALGVPGTATWLAPSQGESRPVRSQSGSHLHSRTHSRSQSQARSISAGNTGHKSNTIGDFNFSAVSFKPSLHHGVGEGKSMSPAASRMNLANILMGSAAKLGGLAARRRGTGVGRQHLAKDGVSGSENENESGQVSSDMSPSESARIRRRRKMMGAGVGAGGASDGEGGRIKRRKTTWREKGFAPLSDGGAEIDEAMKRRSLRLEEPTVSVEMHAERSSQEEEEGKEREHAKKQVIMEEAHETLESANIRLHSFSQLLDELNAVHREGSDIFGEMFMAVPQEVVSILTPELSEDEEMDHTSTAPPLTPTHPHNLLPLSTFAKKLDDIERNPTMVDNVGRMTLDASLPIRAFDALHELDHKLGAIAKQIGDLRLFCDEAEKERWAVKHLYEDIAGNVGTTYPECTDIEQLLSSLVTEDMPWLPSWLPLWVRHLLEIFSNQIQFLVENGLRIYGYVYSVASLFVFLFTLIFSVIFMFARFVRSYWWGFLAAGLGGLAYLMMRPPEGMSVEVDI